MRRLLAQKMRNSEASVSHAQGARSPRGVHESAKNQPADARDDVRRKRPTTARCSRPPLEIGGIRNSRRERPHSASASMASPRQRRVVEAVQVTPEMAQVIRQVHGASREEDGLPDLDGLSFVGCLPDSWLGDHRTVYLEPGEETGRVRCVDGRISWQSIKAVENLAEEQSKQRKRRYLSAGQRHETKALYKKLDSVLTQVAERRKADQSKLREELDKLRNFKKACVVDILVQVGTIAGMVKEEHQVYNKCLSTLAQQVAISCKEQGSLLEAVRFKYSTMFQNLLTSVLKTIDMVQMYHREWLVQTEEKRQSLLKTVQELEEQHRDLEEKLLELSNEHGAIENYIDVNEEEEESEAEVEEEGEGEENGPETHETLEKEEEKEKGGFGFGLGFVAEPKPEKVATRTVAIQYDSISSALRYGIAPVKFCQGIQCNMTNYDQEKEIETLFDDEEEEDVSLNRRIVTIIDPTKMNQHVQCDLEEEEFATDPCFCSFLSMEGKSKCLEYLQSIVSLDETDARGGSRLEEDVINSGDENIFIDHDNDDEDESLTAQERLLGEAKKVMEVLNDARGLPSKKKARRALLNGGFYKKQVSHGALLRLLPPDSIWLSESMRVQKEGDGGPNQIVKYRRESHLAALRVQNLWRKAKAVRVMTRLRQIRLAGRRNKFTQCDSYDIQRAVWLAEGSELSIMVSRTDMEAMCDKVSEISSKTEKENVPNEMLRPMLRDLRRLAHRMTGRDLMQLSEEATPEEEKEEERAQQERMIKAYLAKTEREKQQSMEVDHLKKALASAEERESAEKERCHVLATEVHHLRSTIARMVAEKDLDDERIRTRRRLEQLRREKEFGNFEMMSELYHEQEMLLHQHDQREKSGSFSTLSAPPLEVLLLAEERGNQAAAFKVDRRSPLGQFISEDYNELDQFPEPKSLPWLLAFIRKCYDVLGSKLLERKSNSSVTSPPTSPRRKFNQILDHFIQILEQEGVSSMTVDDKRQQQINASIPSQAIRPIRMKRLPEFVYDLLNAKYGLSSLVDFKVHEFLCTVQRFKLINYEVHLFAQFLDEIRSFEDFWFVLEARMKYCDIELVGGRNGGIEILREVEDALEAGKRMLESMVHSKFQEDEDMHKLIARFCERVREFEKVNGCVTMAAFVDILSVMRRALLVSHRHHEWLYMFFTTLDSDGTGFISRAMFLRLFETHRCLRDATEFDERELGLLFDNIAGRHLGAVDKMNFNCFYHAFRTILGQNNLNQIIPLLQMVQMEREQQNSILDSLRTRSVTSLGDMLVKEKRDFVMQRWVARCAKIYKTIDGLYASGDRKAVRLACEIEDVRLSFQEQLLQAEQCDGSPTTQQIHGLLDTYRLLLCHLGRAKCSQSMNISEIQQQILSMEERFIFQ